MIEFEVFDNDPEVENLIRMYWSVDDDGKPLHKLADLLPFREITTIPKLKTFINKVSKAWEPKVCCSQCGRFKPIFVRNQYVTKHLSSSDYVCDECWDIRIQARNLREAEEKELLFTAIRDESETARNQEIEYGELPNDIAFILLALDRAISPNLVEGNFSAQDLRFLINGSAIPILKQLLDAGAIAPDAELAPPGTYSLEDGILYYIVDQARYFLIPDETYGRSDEALTYLDNRSWEASGLLRNLWLDYAESECTQYFRDQCKAHDLSPTDEDIGYINSQFRSSLERYSIQELWCAIWVIVRDAAALSRRPYYSLTTAAATLPGKFQKLIEDISTGKRQALKAWDRPHFQSAGTLGELFYERFGINERTSGESAMALFSNPTPPAYDAFMQSKAVLDGTVDALIELIHCQKMGAESLSVFAAAIRKGLSTEEAFRSMDSTLALRKEPRQPV